MDYQDYDNSIISILNYLSERFMDFSFELEALSPSQYETLISNLQEILENHLH